jgi:rubredoxin
MPSYIYRCEECGWEFETTDPAAKERLDGGKVRHSSIQYQHGCPPPCLGFMKRVWNTFEFRIKHD